MSASAISRNREDTGDARVVRSVLMICPQYAPIVGGYERAAERLSKELVRQGVSVTVITERRDRLWPAEEMVSGVKVLRLECWYRPGLHILSALFSFFVYLLFQGRDHDVWHVHQYGAHATLAILLSKMLRRPVVMKLTNSGPLAIGAVLATQRASKLHVWAHRQVSACVAISEATANDAYAFGIPMDRVVRIANGIDLDEFRPESRDEKWVLRQRLGLGDKPFAVYVGRLSAQKNPLGLIDAWSSLLRRCPNAWPLYMLGEGPLRADIERSIVSHGLTGRIVVVGPSREVAEWLRAAELYVSSSHHEGLSNTAIEAIACGLPCVVTAASGMEELVGRNLAGVVVPIDDMMSFAASVEALIGNPLEREQMGKNARNAAVRGYGIEAVAKQHLTIYRRAMSEIAK